MRKVEGLRRYAEKAGDAIDVGDGDEDWRLKGELEKLRRFGDL